MKNAILERWRAVLAEKGGGPAILRPDGSVARRFSEIEAEADEIASGLPAGFVVSLQQANSPEWPARLLGIWKAGGCALLVDPGLSAAARDAVERLCGARARLDAGGAAALGNPAADFGGARPDLIKLTSGTSAAPRSILFNAAQLEADCDNVCGTMGIRGDDLNYGVIGFSHSYGFSNLVTPLLCRGVPLVAARDSLPRAIHAGIAATGATVLPAVPAIFQAMTDVEGMAPRLCISAGAPLRVETGRAFYARFGRKIHTFYGASECGGIAYDAEEGEVAAEGFVGRPLNGVQIEPEPEGGILVRSAAVGLRHFPGEEADLRDGAFKPADILEQIPDGWRITGRRTDVINVGGRKVSPGEVEQALLSHPAVREAVAVGVDGGLRTEAVCACIVASGVVSEAELRNHCASRLAAWQVPKSIVQLPAIPLNARGKISRRELAGRFFAD